MRIPFSVFLMPIYCFALSQTTKPVWWEAVLVFVMLHIFLFPASNGYNSYFDRDEESIGGLETPPEVTPDLYWLSWGFDIAAIAIGLYFHPLIAVMALAYGLASKAYSHPSIRLKKHPWASWFIVGFFQGAITYCITWMALEHAAPGDLLQPQVLLAAFLSSALLWGSYPMTQIYQHEEDARRGDLTLSRILGLRGTFYFTAAAFALATSGFGWYFHTYESFDQFLIFQVFLIPVLVFFGWWYVQVHQNPTKANFRNTMWLNRISSWCMIAFFLLITFWK